VRYVVYATVRMTPPDINDKINKNTSMWLLILIN